MTEHHSAPEIVVHLGPGGLALQRALGLVLPGGSEMSVIFSGVV
jgi:hypothetical protein